MRVRAPILEWLPDDNGLGRGHGMAIVHVITKGPQIVTRRGVEMAVLVPVDQWRRLEETSRPTLKELLLSAAPRAEIPVPLRRARRRREPSALD